MKVNFSYIYCKEFNVYMLSRINQKMPLPYDSIVNYPFFKDDEEILKFRRKIMFECDGAIASIDDIYDGIADFYEIVIMRSEEGIKKIIDYLNSLLIMYNLEEDEE